MNRTFISGGINWDWYLCGDFNAADKTVHVYFYDRWHRYDDRGSKAPKSYEVVQGFAVLEDDKREAFGIRVDGVEYLITNPGYVFGYRDFSPLHAN